MTRCCSPCSRCSQPPPSRPLVWRAAQTPRRFPTSSRTKPPRSSRGPISTWCRTIARAATPPITSATQPRGPKFKKDFWRAEVTKMIKIYGAPIDEADVARSSNISPRRIRACCGEVVQQFSACPGRGAFARRFCACSTARSRAGESRRREIWLHPISGPDICKRKPANPSAAQNPKSDAEFDRSGPKCRSLPDREAGTSRGRAVFTGYAKSSRNGQKLQMRRDNDRFPPKSGCRLSYQACRHTAYRARVGHAGLRGPAVRFYFLIPRRRRDG